MPGVFNFNNPTILYDKLSRNYYSFLENPSADGVLDVIFLLYHLREWICPGGHDSYKNKPADEFSREEILHSELYEMPMYQIVKDLCNCLKHYNSQNLEARTVVLNGFRAGYGRAGDSLGVTHFVVDGIELREVFVPLFESYRAYFLEMQSR